MDIAGEEVTILNMYLVAQTVQNSSHFQWIWVTLWYNHNIIFQIAKNIENDLNFPAFMLKSLQIQYWFCYCIHKGGL